MKKIFQTLRQKWPEYTLEVLVIMIGILGAFALNNWNDSRKNRIAEQKILKTLKSNFESNRVQIQDNISETKELVSGLEGMLTVFRMSNIEIQQLNTDSIESRMGGHATFHPSDGGLNSLLQSGGLNIIESDSLKNRLTDWPYAVEDVREDEVYLSNYFKNQLLTDLVKYRSFTRNPKFKINKMALYNDHIMENHYVFMYSMARYQLTIYKDLDKEITEILRLIEKELH